MTTCRPIATKRNAIGTDRVQATYGALMQTFADIFRQVIQSIWANRLRSFLTMFGIAWGVASLLLLIGLGEGFRSGQTRNLASVGSDLIMIFGGTVPALPNQHAGMHPYKLTVGDAEAIRADAPHVRNATAFIDRGDLKEVSEFSSAGGPVVGVQANYPEVRHLPLTAGRFFDEEDEAQQRQVVVLGQKNNELLFQSRRSVGSFITINGYRFEVIGVADSIGRGNNNGENQKIYIPLTAMLQIFPIKGENVPTDALSSIQYQPTTTDLNESAKLEVHRIIAKRHGFDPGNKDAFEEWDSIKSGRMVGVIFTAMDVFLGGVGIVTLGLGAVGIINIMLVTVQERTKEIGLRKALGATNRSIMTQFFIEGLTLTGLSGLIGIGAAAVIMVVLGHLMGNAVQGFDSPRLVPWSAAMAVGTLALCGVVAGVYPARRAAMLEPVEALRKD